MYNLTQKLTAEFLGTFALVFFGAGAVCVDFQLRSNSTGGIGLLAIALAPALAAAILISALGHISGGHFNPAVTIGFWVTKRVNTLDALSYWGAQLLGASAAAFLLKAGDPSGNLAQRRCRHSDADDGFSPLGSSDSGSGCDVFPGAGGVRHSGG